MDNVLDQINNQHDNDIMFTHIYL